ncbi:ribosomal subunit interface protein [Meinhardsimonia xiamenensis]|jgi:ribosomal subunit interface protein|uniref:Ribosome hibernation promoting factor n=1 Tax=Meinhardsimonia xiamenensis TaxID=990712 RepID=A0A1G9DWL1_9RHOB|nr:ribosome-associated translation inhibitor RaiA [Meinhardsimonia xiamenensis]PRX31166.1 SSU ribosomal protein S30P /sigma 54 modulation protein [Meinhardsimonia xiamenensis]SDK68255.1 ribosomal subunit interface protein [Meinhardsimonia xiamenensis]
MRYQISGKGMEIGTALQTHVQDEIADMVDKYALRATDAHVVFSPEAHAIACEAVVHLSTGLLARCHATGGDAYAAFDSAVEKMDKQLRRHKRKLRDHHHKRAEPVEVTGGATYILAPSEGDDGAEEAEPLQPVIIAETQTVIPSVSVGEAVMQMELASAAILVFRNERNGEINVVYRREDGNIGWIDPSAGAAG